MPEPASEARGLVARREDDRRFRALAESISQLIWTARPDGAVDYFNRRWFEYTGTLPAQSFGAGWLEQLHPDDRARAWRDWQNALAARQPVETEYRIRAADGSHQWFLARGTPILDKHGVVTQWTGSCTNIHAQKQAEHALKEADRRKDEFLATLAHELRNPLAPIRNAVQLIQLQGMDAPDAKWALDVIDRQTRQMARLMDDLLDVSRITRNLLELRRERVELAEVVRAAVETSRPLIEQMDHRLIVAVAPGAVFLDADLTRLGQALSNILNNAAKYTERGGRIELTAGRRGDAAVIMVRDNGIGIAPEMQSRIFEMFAQADRSLERSRGGLGIGLALAQRLVAMHGGSLALSSAGAGEGCEFTIRLPVAPLAETAGRAPDEGEKPSEAQPKSRRILVVDDNRIAAMTLSMLLKQSGHTLRTAHDGEEAVAAAAEFAPEVVVLDIGLPKLNGYDAAQQIRALPGGPDILLIALTGWGQDEDKARSQDAGFDHHLVKPVDAATLNQLLNAPRV